MPDKQPKRPNDYAKALESWESEGGAPASDDRSRKRKRPRDLNQITKAQAIGGNKLAKRSKAETMSPQSDLRVEVVDDEIIVTLPQSHYSATYYTPEKAPKLLPKNLPDRDDPRAPMSVSEFLDKAWKLAKDKARELGWDWSE
jgi:hypothetical protein